MCTLSLVCRHSASPLLPPFFSPHSIPVDLPLSPLSHFLLSSCSLPVVRSIDPAQNTAVIMSVEGRMHGVDLCYLEEPCANYLDAVVDTVFSIHDLEGPGDVLVFLPGQVRNQTYIHRHTHIDTQTHKHGCCVYLPCTSSALPPTLLPNTSSVPPPPPLCTPLLYTPPIYTSCTPSLYTPLCTPLLYTPLCTPSLYTRVG